MSCSADAHSGVKTHERIWGRRPPSREGEKHRGPKVSLLKSVRVASLVCLSPPLNPSSSKPTSALTQILLLDLHVVITASLVYHGCTLCKETGSCHRVKTICQDRDAAEVYWILWLKNRNGRWRSRRLLVGFILGWTQWRSQAQTAILMERLILLFLCCAHSGSQKPKIWPLQCNSSQLSLSRHDAGQ